jgi:hypothetical protein
LRREDDAPPKPVLRQGYLSGIAERAIDTDLAVSDFEVGPLQDEHLGGSQSNVCGEEDTRAERWAVSAEQVERSVGEVADLGLAQRYEVAPTAPLVKP